MVDARRTSGRKNVAPKLFMMVKLKRDHCTARSTVLVALPAMVKDKSGEGSQTAVCPKPSVWKLKDEETVRLFSHEMAV